MVDVALLFNEPCIDAIWDACWENLLANSPRIEGLMDCMNECVLDNTATIEEKKSEIMSWKYVFNSTVGDKWWSVIQNANNAAKECGYKFFTWNGCVYAVDGDQTGILVDDLF